MLNLLNTTSANNGTRFNVVAIEGDMVFARIEDCPKSPLYLWNINGSSVSMNETYDLPLLPYMDLSDVRDLTKIQSKVVYHTADKGSYRFLAQDGDSIYLALDGSKNSPAYVWHYNGTPISFGTAKGYGLVSIEIDGAVFPMNGLPLIDLEVNDFDEDDMVFHEDNMVDGFDAPETQDYFMVSSDDFADVMMNRDALYHTMNTIIGAAGNIDTQAAVVMVLNAIQKDLSR